MLGYMVCDRAYNNRIRISSMRLFPSWEEAVKFLQEQSNGWSWDVYELFSVAEPTKVNYKKVREAVGIRRGIV